MTHQYLMGRLFRPAGNLDPGETRSVRKFTTMVVALLVTMGLFAGLSQANGPEETIKKVMKVAFNKKSGLCGSVLAGRATAAQKQELLKAFQDLARAEPPQGSPESWKTRTTALVRATQAVIDDEAGAGAALKKAANCGACHQVHKVD